MSVLVPDCSRGGQAAAEGKVNCVVSRGVGRQGHVYRPACLRGPAHIIMGHACCRHRGEDRLAVPRRCGLRA